MTTKEEPKIGKKVGFIAGKLINLAHTGAKKLEDYAQKSAEENQNENARKLAKAMNKLSQKLEEKQESYIEKVEKNTDDLVNNAQKVYAELKNRALIAKEKADQDSKEDTEKS